MSNGQSKIRTAPPKSAARLEDLERLGKLDTWTEQPALEAAAALGDHQEPEPAPVEVQTQPEKRKPSPKKPKAPAYPWQGLENSAGQQLNIKVPASLYFKLKWLGETTYGTNQTKIAISALEERVNAMLEERGIK